MNAPLPEWLQVVTQLGAFGVVIYQILIVIPKRDSERDERFAAALKAQQETFAAEQEAERAECQANLTRLEAALRR